MYVYLYIYRYRDMYTYIYIYVYYIWQFIVCMYIYIYIYTHVFLLGNGYHIQGPLPIGPITLGPIFWGRLFVGVGAATAAIARQLLQQFFNLRVAQGISLGVSPIVLSACIVVVLCLSQNDLTAHCLHLPLAESPESSGHLCLASNLRR